jgi:hypothetical protein
LFLLTVVYIYNLSLLGQINSQQDNGTTLDVAYIVFIDNEVVDGDINVLARPCQRAFLRFFQARHDKLFSWEQDVFCRFQDTRSVQQQLRSRQQPRMYRTSIL